MQATMPRTINHARTLANIRERASRITDEYRLVFDILDRCYFVQHKTESDRRYRITSNGCSCPARTHYGTCKHWQGLAALVMVEEVRYTLLRLERELIRVREFKATIKARFGH